MLLSFFPQETLLYFCVYNYTDYLFTSSRAGSFNNMRVYLARLIIKENLNSKIQKLIHHSPTFC